MDERAKWISAKIRLGWLFVIAGALVVIMGIIMEQRYASLPYNFRIITGLGILLLGIGIGHLVRYRALQGDQKSARRLSAEERDERTLLIRARAGNRAYWVSAALVYAGLMWASFAANGDLPTLCGDTLWFFLATCTLVPFGVYAISTVVDQRTL